MRWGVVVLLAGCGRIAFDPIGTDGPGSDTTLPDIGLRWVTTSETRGTSRFWITRPLDSAGFGTACESPASDDALFLLGHPTLPYA